MDSSGNLYGATQWGGSANPADGTVFEIAKGSNTITTLASFNGANGAHPLCALAIDSSGNLYGTTEFGGAIDDGTVFELPRGSSSITTLVSFDGINGSTPFGAVILDSSGNLYGTTEVRGPQGFGTVFELSRATNTITTLASFNGTNGGDPYAGLIMDSSRNLYGTTKNGGANDLGTVFELVKSPTAEIDINDTPDPSDNITLFNPDGSELPFCQKIPAKITNTSNSTETLQLSVQQVGSGNAMLDQQSVTLAAGASTEVTITPTADSSAPNDVQIIASANGAQVAEDALTVIGVAFSNEIYNDDTPDAMLARGQYRIPPRVDTPIDVSVTPTIPATSSPFVSLTVVGQDAINGTVNIDGNPTENLTSSAKVRLFGGIQTSPGSADNLQLALQVRGQVTIRSDGFSVAAIPLNYSDDELLVLRHFTVTGRGFRVQGTWDSDSGVIADLDQVHISEAVEYPLGEGLFRVPPEPKNSKYLPGTSSGTPDAVDNIVVPLSDITGLLKAFPGVKDGFQEALQTSKFVDDRTGAFDVPMQKSGYLITRAVYPDNGILYITTTLAGEATTANGISSDAGATMPSPISETQPVESLPPGDPLVVTAQPPGRITAGSGFGLVVTAENSDGSVNTSFNGSVMVSDVDGNPFSGTTTVTAVNGIATFSGLVLNQAGADALSVSATGLPTVTTNSFMVTAAPATQLVVSGPSRNVTAGAPFSVTVSARDPFSNLDRTFTGTVTLGLASSPAGATLGGVLTANAINGVATFTNLTLSSTGTGYGLQATSPGLTPAMLSPLTGTPPGVATQLVVTTPPPASVSAGSSFGLVVSAEDGLGTVDTSFNGTVSILSPLGATLGGLLTVTAVDGVATFSGLTLDQPASYALSVSSDGLPATTTPLFSVTAPATRLVVAAQPTAVTSGAGFGLVIQAEDTLGNVDPSFNGTVTLTLANNPGSSTLGGTLTATAVNGVATFSGLTMNNPGAGYTLQATADGLPAVTTAAIDVTPPGVATRLVVTTQPLDTFTAGSPFGFVVQAEDGFGTVDTSFNGSITVDDPNDGSSLATVTAVNGVTSFSSLSLSQAGDYLLPVTSNTLPTTTTSLVVVTAGPASQLAFVGPSVNVLPGSPFDFEVLALDANGNIDPTFNGSVTLALANNPGGANLAGTLTATASDGVASFSGLTIDKPGAGYTLQATTPGLPSMTSFPFNGTTDQLVVTTQPPAGAATGSGFGLVVSVQNSSGAVDASFDGSVALFLISLDGTHATLSGTLTTKAVKGVASFTGLSVNQAGSYGLAVTSNGVGEAATQAINVSGPTLSLPSFSGLSAPTITYGTASTTIAGQLQSGSAQPVPPGEKVAITLGAATQDATLDSMGDFAATFDTSSLAVSGSPYTITFSYPGDASFSAVSASSTLTVTQAAPSFTGLSAPAITYGTATTTISGQLQSNSTQLVPAGETVQVTLHGVTQQAVLDSGDNFTATFDTSTLGVSGSPYPITFSYAGDSNFATASGSADVTVNMAGTTTAVSATPPSSTFGQEVTFTATVSANAPGSGTPTGTVAFSDGSTPLGTIALSGGSATVSTSSLSVGSHTITGTYSGDGNFMTSSANASETVSKAGTTTALASSVSSAVAGRWVTFTATVTASPAGAGAQRHGYLPGRQHDAGHRHAQQQRRGHVRHAVPVGRTTQHYGRLRQRSVLRRQYQCQPG
jgi:uncharacterized repeat protein (TIGR03803 family)